MISWLVRVDAAANGCMSVANAYGSMASLLAKWRHVLLQSLSRCCLRELDHLTQRLLVDGNVLFLVDISDGTSAFEDLV